MAEGEPAEALCSELLGLPTDAAAAVVTRWLEKRGMSRTLTSFADEAPGTAHSKHSGGVCASVAGPQGPMHRAPLARTLARAARHLWREAEAHGLAPGACSQERRLSAVFPRFRWRVRLRWLLPMRGAAAMRPQGWGRPRRALQPAQRARSSVTACHGAWLGLGTAVARGTACLALPCAGADPARSPSGAQSGADGRGAASTRRVAAAAQRRRSAASPPQTDSLSLARSPSQARRRGRGSCTTWSRSRRSRCRTCCSPSRTRSSTARGTSASASLASCTTLP